MLILVTLSTLLSKSAATSFLLSHKMIAQDEQK